MNVLYHEKGNNTYPTSHHYSAFDRAEITNTRYKMTQRHGLRSSSPAAGARPAVLTGREGRPAGDDGQQPAPVGQADHQQADDGGLDVAAEQVRQARHHQREPAAADARPHAHHTGLVLWGDTQGQRC